MATGRCSTAVSTYRHRLTEARSVRLGYSYRRASYSYLRSVDRPGRTAERTQRLRRRRGQSRVLVLATNHSLARRRHVALRCDVSDPAAPAGRQAALRLRRRRRAFDRQDLAVRRSVRSRKPVRPGLWRAGLRQRVSVSASGFVNTRVDITAWVSHTDGEPIVGGDQPGVLDQHYGGRVRYALSRNWALTGEYFRYRYRFHQLATLSVPDRRAAAIRAQQHQRRRRGLLPPRALSAVRASASSRFGHACAGGPMCGIAGILGPLTEGNQSALQRMTDALAHRGPDGAGTWGARRIRAASAACSGTGGCRSSTCRTPAISR